MSWDLDETEVLVNGNESDYEPREGEILAHLVKRIADNEGFKSVDVSADGITVEQTDAETTMNASEFDTINVSRHALVG